MAFSRSRLVMMATIMLSTVTDGSMKAARMSKVSECEGEFVRNLQRLMEVPKETRQRLARAQLVHHPTNTQISEGERERKERKKTKNEK